MNNIKEELSKLITQKKSREFYAKRLNITVDQVTSLLNEIRGDSPEIVITEAEQSKRYNIEDGVIEINTYYDHEPTVEEIVRSHKIDTTKYKLSNYWSKAKNKGWQVSALFKSINTQESVTQDFIQFLQTYKPVQPKYKTIVSEYNEINNEGCLIINKQDIHYNKEDRRGNNDINDRFKSFETKVFSMLKKASNNSNLNKVIYIVGSDLFNSEFTGTTTHGTPQQNIMNHNDSFAAICNHEVKVLELITSFTSNVEIIYVPGNHDFYIGWHLVKWIEAYFRLQNNIKVDTTDKYSKYRRIYNSAVCFNHGYKVKPEVLANNFPIEFKKEWANCDNHYIFVGDLHTDMSKTIGGIQFYRLAQASNAISKWDEENGYTLSKGTVTGFLIEENIGVSTIFKQ
jgi:hypothetical protein